MSLYALFTGPGPSGFGYSSTADDVTEGLDLTGKTYLITGCNSGLGLEAMRVLGRRGAHVIAAARSRDKAEVALAGVSSAGTPVACDLSDPGSVRACIEAVRGLDIPLDGIIANAGIMALPQLERRNGVELQFFTNHVGHFMLVTGLLRILTDTGRVVILSSAAHKGAPPGGIEFDNLSGEKGYRPWRAYGQSKLANLLFAKHLATRMPRPGQTANSLHPGVIATKLVRHMNPVVGAAYGLMGWIALKTIPEGAATEVYLATHPGVAEINGAYFADCNQISPSKYGQDAALAQRLWEKTEEIVAALPS
ncbi:MAG: SDR family oxidoreductase [Nannocystaceae bacterium]